MCESKSNFRFFVRNNNRELQFKSKNLNKSFIILFWKKSEWFLLIRPITSQKIYILLIMWTLSTNSCFQKNIWLFFLLPYNSHKDQHIAEESFSVNNHWNLTNRHVQKLHAKLAQKTIAVVGVFCSLYTHTQTHVIYM